jgi:ubiquinone/menaquinone biosynthesis C-methylase UbiE
MPGSTLVYDSICTRVQLRCTGCKADTEGLDCTACGCRIQMRNGIVYALPPERAAHYARFAAEYQSIRAAEGRGSPDEEYYLGLPHKDSTGKNSVQWRIRARSFDYLLQHILKPEDDRRSILDLGAGNCWMSFQLALRGLRPIAVDLLTNDQDGLAAGVHYQKHLSKPLLRFQAEFNSLPFRDRQFDTVIFNASFHYSEDYELTLREALRCLKIGGRVIISDTPWYSREESGKQMIAERHAAFLKCFGTASDSVKSLEYLTDERLRILEEKLFIHWTIFAPWYGLRWALRPWSAKFSGKREPSKFRLYVATKHG